MTKPILVLPALQWNDTASTWKYAVLPNAGQIKALLGGLRFGMTPEEVGQHLPERSSALHWDDLPNAKEYAQDVRYVWLPMQAADSLTGPIQSCYGDSSSVYLLFFNQALFRISWRFLPDGKCPDVTDAAEDLYAALVPIVPAIVISARYAVGSAQVVDMTAPNAGPLISVRWRGQGR
ncbi:MAG TPA: hypothetical protein VME47_04595 [Acetobacteraceae bacterium]|nr:hypothetical protein [Acetobacteraceae bacterium]